MRNGQEKGLSRWTMISPDDPKLGSISQEQVDECHCIELRLIARATNLCERERERERENISISYN